MKPLPFLFIFFFALAAYGQYAANNATAITVSISTHAEYGNRTLKNKKGKPFFTISFDETGKVVSKNRTANILYGIGPDYAEHYEYHTDQPIKANGYYYDRDDTLYTYTTDYFYNNKGQLTEKITTPSNEYINGADIIYIYDSTSNESYKQKDIIYYKTLDSPGRLQTCTQWYGDKLFLQKKIILTLILLIFVNTKNI